MYLCSVFWQSKHMIIGITGGIGSGKSTLSAELRRLGYTVYDTDSEAKRLIVEDADVRARIIDLLGDDVYDGNTYRTDLVAARVFADSSLLASLNAIVHPAVARDIIQRSGLTAQRSFFIECAILHQSGLDKLCDKVVLVTAPEDVRIARVIARDHTDIDKVRARIRAQQKDADIPADILIHNDGVHPIADLAQEVLSQSCSK